MREKRAHLDDQSGEGLGRRKKVQTFLRAYAAASALGSLIKLRVIHVHSQSPAVPGRLRVYAAVGAAGSNGATILSGAVAGYALVEDLSKDRAFRLRQWFCAASGMRSVTFQSRMNSRSRL